jgi:hypothetical protein
MSNLRKSVLPSIGSTNTSQEAPPAEPVAFSQGGDTLPRVPAPQAPGEAVSLAQGDLACFGRPTEAQVRVKARFWAKWAEQPLVGGQTPSLATIQAITGSAAIKTWWSRAGFADWFLNTRVTDERLEYLMHLALSAAEDILLSDDPRTAGYRVSMIKTVAEMAGRTGQARQAPTAAAALAAGRGRVIDNMNHEDLVKLLAGSGLKIERVLQVETATPEPTPQPSGKE